MSFLSLPLYYWVNWYLHNAGANTLFLCSFSATFHHPFLFPFSRLLALAIPLLFFPRLLSLIFGSLLTASGELASSNEGAVAGLVNNQAPEVIRQLNVLERSLAGVTGLALSALAAMLVVQVSSFLRSTVHTPEK